MVDNHEKLLDDKTKLDLEFMVDEEKWAVIVGMKGTFLSSENCWAPDPKNKKLYVGKYLVKNLDFIKNYCREMYKNNAAQHHYYF